MSFLSRLTYPSRTESPELETPEQIAAFIDSRALEYPTKLEDDFVQRALGLGVEGGMILDVGTRVGLIALKILWQNENFFAIGMDRSSAMIDRARETAAAWQLGDRAFFQVGDARKMRLKTAYFDLVIADSTLHVFDDPVSVLHEINRVLKPRGGLLIRELQRPSRFQMQRKIEEHSSRYGSGMRPHITTSLRAAFTRDEVQGLVQASGLERVRVTEPDEHHFLIERTGESDPEFMDQGAGAIPVVEKVLIIGGNAAGLTAAARAIRIDPRLDVTVLEKGPDISYSTCGIPYFLSKVVQPNDLISYTPESFEKERGIKVHNHTLVDEIAPSRKRVMGTRTDTGERVEFSYDRLLIATGVRPRLPDIPGTNLKNVFTLLNLQDALSINDMIDKVKRVAIIGGGYVGLEMAECLHSRGKTIHLYERESHVLPGMDPDMAQIIEYELQRFGVRLSTSAKVLALVSGETGVAGVKAASGLGIDPAEMVLLDTGVVPNVDLARDAGVQIGVTGGVAVNGYMETNVPSIFAAGNCAEMFCAIRRRPVPSYIGTIAAKQGRVAGENMAGHRAKFHGGIGTTIVKVFDLAVARTGLCSDAAAEESMPVVSARIEALDRAAYFPGAGKIWVKLIAERQSRKLVGAQVAGYGEASKRIDVAATAITAGMRVDELAQLDLAYSPPYGNLWDPLLIAAQAVLRKLSL